MGTGSLGGGVMFLIIALLWAAVLVPAWNRRREFNAAERNALRLQRTLRILAETAEVPQEVRLEATAREALAHEKLLRTAQKRQEADRAADLAAAEADRVRAEIRAQQMQRKQVAMNRAAKLRKPIVRRVRSLAALCGLAGIIGAFVGVGMLIAGIGPAVLLWSLLLFTVGLGSLVLLAPGRAKLESIPAEQVEAPTEASNAAPEVAEPPVVDRVSSVDAHASAQRAAAERIERARILARAREARVAAPRENLPDSMLLREVREQVARTAGVVSPPTSKRETAQANASAQTSAAAEERSARVTQRGATDSRAAGPTQQTSASQTGRSPLSDLGVVGDTSDGMPNLDQVLRRRRNAG